MGRHLKKRAKEQRKSKVMRCPDTKGLYVALWMIMFRRELAKRATYAKWK